MANLCIIVWTSIFFLHSVCAEFYINTVVDEPGEECNYFVWDFNKIFTTGGGELHDQWQGYSWNLNDQRAIPAPPALSLALSSGFQVPASSHFTSFHVAMPEHSRVAAFPWNWFLKIMCVGRLYQYEPFRDGKQDIST